MSIVRLSAFAAAAIIAANGLVPSATAQAPRPIRSVVTFAAGASVLDTIPRILAEPLSQALGQPVLVENRPGGAGAGGTEIVARAAADGQTLLYSGLSTIVDAFNS